MHIISLLLNSTTPSSNQKKMKYFMLLLALLACSVSALVPPVAMEVNVAAVQHSGIFQNPSSAMQDGLQKYMNAPAAMESSTLSLSLKDRPPPPTAEELAQKKRNFNFWFWGELLLLFMFWSSSEIVVTELVLTFPVFQRNLHRRWFRGPLSGNLLLLWFQVLGALKN
jgi:hypothetical protein